MVNVKCETTLTFSQDDILELVVEHIAANFGVDVPKDKLHVSVDEGSSGYGDYTPPHINSISVTVPSDTISK
jgi:hypothetical protein